MTTRSLSGTQTRSPSLTPTPPPSLLAVCHRHSLPELCCQLGRARNGVPMVSVVAVEDGLLASDASAAVSERQGDLDSSAAEAAAAELANEASMAAEVPIAVDLTFARCFMTSEEALFKIPSKIVGQEMWTQQMETARLKSFGAFLNRILFEGAEIDSALTALAMADELRIQFAKEKRTSSTVHPEAPGAMVAQRAQLAWAERANFVATWKDRLPAAYEPAKPSYAGLSAVGRLRAQRAYERQLSGENPEESAEAAAAKANKWFADWAARNKF